MEVDILFFAPGKARAKKIATDSPAFFGLGLALAKKIAQIFLLNFVKDFNFDKVNRSINASSNRHITPLLNRCRKFQHGFNRF